MRGAGLKINHQNIFFKADGTNLLGALAQFVELFVFLLEYVAEDHGGTLVIPMEIPSKVKGFFVHLGKNVNVFKDKFSPFQTHRRKKVLKQRCNKTEGKEGRNKE